MNLVEEIKLAPGEMVVENTRNRVTTLTWFEPRSMIRKTVYWGTGSDQWDSKFFVKDPKRIGGSEVDQLEHLGQYLEYESQLMEALTA